MSGIEPVKDSRDEIIRSRLLHSLGIHRTRQNAACIRERPSDSSRIMTSSIPIKYPRNRDVKLLGNEAPISRSLNDTQTHSSHDRPITNHKRLVRFNSIVKEKPIASHKKYSNRIRKTLWSDSEEIQQNAYRNQIEYQAEGMHWQSVLENEDMYTDAKTGELIHPFWVESNDATLFS